MPLPHSQLLGFLSIQFSSPLRILGMSAVVDSRLDGGRSPRPFQFQPVFPPMISWMKHALAGSISVLTSIIISKIGQWALLACKFQQSDSLQSRPPSWQTQAPQMHSYHHVWLSPHQLTKPHLLSYAVVIYSSHLWSSSLAIYAGRLAAYQDIIVDDDPDLPFHVKHYSDVREKNQVDFSISSLSQSCGFGPILLPVLSKPPFCKFRSMMLYWCFPVSRKAYLSS